MLPLNLSFLCFMREIEIHVYVMQAEFMPCGDKGIIKLEGTVKMISECI